MSLLIARELGLSYGKKDLFRDASFNLGPRERVGLIGPNGTGKSSLLKIVSGQLVPDVGTITLRKNARVGYLPQDLVAAPDATVIDSVLAAVPGRDALGERLADVERALDATREPDEQLELSQQLADLHTEIDHFEEKFGRHRAERILAGLGFRENDFARPVPQLSGGWRMRAALAGLLLQDPDLLLLDEPTNHLDLPTLAWFDEFLRRSARALVLISHDRDFLDRQISRVLSLEPEGLRSYPGTYEDYLRLRAEEVEQLEARAARQAAKRAETEAFIERFRAKATKARQVQSRVKALEREQTVELREERARLHFRFPEVARSGREVAIFDNVRKSYGERVVYDGLDATVERGRRVAIVGVNGAGKTTMLKLLAGEIQPDAGRVTLGHNVVLGYYAQHHTEALDASATVLEEVAKLVPDKPQSHVRGVLGAFLFSGDDVDKRISVLSGGERARVSLAKLLLVPSNLLVMDEPTNHLDLDSSEALIDALTDYDGTLVFVSHNRSFLNRLATDVWDVRDHRVVPYPGNLDEYLHHLRQAALARDAGEPGAANDSGATPVAKAPSEKERKRAEAEARQRRSAVEGPVKKEIAAVEARVAELEAAQKERETQLADPAVYDDFARARAIDEAHRAAAKELETLYARWESLQERLAALAAEHAG